MEPKLPPLPLDLDTSPARMSIQIKAGELVRLLHEWGREVYAAGQGAPTLAAAMQVMRDHFISHEATPPRNWIADPSEAPAAPQAASPATVKDALRRCGADTDYHGKMLFTVAQFDHFVSMIRPVAPQAASQSDGDPWQLGFEAGKRVGAQLAPQAASQQAGELCGSCDEGWLTDLHDMEQGMIRCPKCSPVDASKADARRYLGAPQAATTASASDAEQPCEGLHDYQVSNARTGEQSCTLCGKEWEGFASATTASAGGAK